MGRQRNLLRPATSHRHQISFGMVVEESRPATEERVRLTDVNPHLVCVLCHGYFVDATTITECLHSFCRSCIFRHLETKPFCPICEVQVHTRLHRSLKADKTLQDIVYKLVPGLFHNEMERRREFYKLHPHRDEHLEPERRGVGLDRLIYSPSDTISLSLEFYDSEREKEEWSAVTCAKPQKDGTISLSGNSSKRYLQCPAEFKMAHLKKFIRQKYNLSPNAEVEIIYKRESLPDTYSLMDVAYIYTWKRNGPMRFYYRLPGIVDMGQYEKMQALVQASENELTLQEVTKEENHEGDKKNENIKKNVLEEVKFLPKPEPPNVNSCETPKVGDKQSPKEVVKVAETASAVSKPAVPNIQEKVEKIILSLKKSPKKDSNDVPIYEVSTVSSSATTSEPKAKTVVEEMPPKSKSTKSKETSKESNSVKMSKQDELPVSVLLSLGQCRVQNTENKVSDSVETPATVVSSSPIPSMPENKPKSLSNGRMSVNRIANELQQRAAINGIQKSKENLISQNSPQQKTSQNIDEQQVFNFPDPINNKLNSPSKTKKPSPNAFQNTKTSSSDMGIMDQRIQQLYRTQGLVASHNNNSSNVKSESRLANWLNNRFQTKPQPVSNQPVPNTPSLAQNISNRFPNNSTPPTKTFKNIAPKIASTNHSPYASKVPTSSSHSSPKSSMSNGMPPPSKPVPKFNSPKNSLKKSSSSKTHKLSSSSVSQVTTSSPVTVSLAASVASMPLVSANGTTVALAENVALPGNVTPRPTVNYFVPNFSTPLPSMSLLSSPVHVPSYGVKTNHGIVYAPMVGITRNFDNNKIRNGYMKPAVEEKAKPPTENVPPESSEEAVVSPKVTTESAVETTKPTSATCDSALTNGTSSPPVTNGLSKEPVESLAKPQLNGKSSKVDEEVNKLKRKLEELKKMNENKVREVAGCQITKENPDSDEAKRRRDVTPVVSIELMRGKRPVPGLKAIQDVVELGKRKAVDEKKPGEKKLKLSTKKETKGEESNALDLSRCGVQPQNPTMPHWFNPMVNQYLSSNK